MAVGTVFRSVTYLLCLVILTPCVLAAASVVPAPIVISPSQYWEGNDGPWSTFTVQVGTPAQNVRVLVSTAGTATWVVLPEGCPVGSPPDCVNLRGQQFIQNASSSWQFNNFYELVLESNIGLAGSGGFGFDRVGLGWQGDGGPVLDHQVVAGIATEDFWLGSFGLTPRPTNFTDFNDPQLSFLQTLQNKSQIPSLSWSYTAGAPYRFDKVPGSLVLGGYDLAKAGPTNMSFAFGPDISRDLTFGLQKITMSAEGKSAELLEEGILTFIDSAVPHIWLPVVACEAFEREFGLTWNETVELYLVNDTLHDTLISRNTSLVFKIGNATEGGQTIDITFPYASFDLVVDYPIVSNRTRYFPIARAVNDTQYTIGRMFLQEAYLTVDYERSKFYLSQTQFQAGVSQHIITIPSINPTSTDSPSGSSLSAGAIAGIAVAGGLVVIGLLTGLFFVRCHRQRRTKDEADISPHPPDKDVFQKAELDARPSPSHGQEIEGKAVEYFQPDKTELPESSVASPVSSPMSSNPAELAVPIYEMVGDIPNLPELQTVERPQEVR